MVPRAGAVAVEAATVAYAGALVGTILVGAGVIFSSHGDMQKVGAAMYKSWISSKNAIADKIGALAGWAVEHGQAAAKGALRIGKELYQAVVDAFNAGRAGDVFSSVDVTFDLVRATGDCSDLQSYFDTHAVRYLAFSTGGYLTITSDSTSWHWNWFLPNNNSGSRDVDFDFTNPNFTHLGMYVQMKQGNFSFGGAAYGGASHYWISSVGSHTVYSDVTVSVGSSAPIPLLGHDLAYPSDDYLVKMPDLPAVDGVTGSVTWPSDTAYTKDAVAVPYPVDSEGVKVPDIPYDKVVDRSTGKTLDDTDTGTDTDKPSKPGEGTDTSTNLLDKIIQLLKNFFDSPSDFRLNMDGFRNLAIKDKFPFCIPFDMVDSVKQFAATASDYQFRIKLDTQYFQVDHTVDLTPLALPLAFFRYLVVVWFVWVLMSRTHDLIKW